MERIYTNATTKFALLMVSLVIIGCSDSDNTASAKYKEPDTSSFHEDEGSSTSTSHQTSNKSITYGSYSYEGGTTIRTVTLPNNITYMITSTAHCPDEWHEMTINECIYLHDYGSHLDPFVFEDPFEIIGKTSTCRESWQAPGQGGVYEYSCRTRCNESGYVRSSTNTSDKTNLKTRCVKGELPTSSSSYDKISSSASSSESKDNSSTPNYCITETIPMACNPEGYGMELGVRENLICYCNGNEWTSEKVDIGEW